MKSSWLHLSLACLALGLVVGVFECTAFDLWLQDFCYNFETKRWLIRSDMTALNWSFYRGPKYALMLFGVSLLLRGLLPTRFWSPLTFSRPAAWLVLLCLILVPVTVAILKDTTGIYCPRQIERYGGSKPYFQLFQALPPALLDAAPGRCFPAGHPSGGFALICLYFVGRSRQRKLVGLSTGLILGGAMGAYQMLKGAHYLSHVLVTLALAWVIACVLNCFFRLPDSSDT